MTRRFRPARFPGRGVVASATRPGKRADLDPLELGLVYDAFVRSPIATAMIATDGGLVRCNEAWVAFIGAFARPSCSTRASPARSSRANAPGSRTPSTTSRRATRRAGGASCASCAPTAATPGGRVTLTAIRDDERRPVVVFAQVDDVTERRSADRLRGISQSISDVLALSADLANTLPATLRLLCRGLEVDAGAVWLRTGEGLTMTCAAAWSEGRPLPAAGVGTARLHERHFSVAAHGVLVNHAARGIDWATPLRAAVAPSEPWRTGACVALRAGDRLLGAIELYRSGVEPAPASIETWLAGVGARVAAQILRRQSEDELARLAEELARSNGELERYAAVVSHDLCQPLRVVGGYAALLSHRHAGDLDDEARGYVDRLTAGVDSMQRLVDDLLDYARVGRARSRASPWRWAR